MNKFTAPQLKALTSAADTGNAWNAWGNVYRASTDRMMKALCAKGLLTADGRPTDKTADALGLRVAYGATNVGAAVVGAGIEPRHPTLADVAAKFEDEPLYECEIPGAPGRITYGVAVELEAISEPATGRATREIPPGTYTGTIEAVTTNAQGDIVARVELLSGKVELRDHQKAAVADVVHGMQGRFITIPLHTGKIRARKRHRPKTYKPHTLGIDTFKVTYSARCNSLEDLRRLDAQDAKVCRIEQELVQYAGKRCTPHRDRKVAKLRRILRILKRGIYE